MSAEVILIIVGAALLLIALIDVFRGESATDLINAKVRIPFGILGLLLIIYGGYADSAINLQGQIEQPEVGNIRTISAPVTKALVTSPIEGDQVGCRILTMGKYPQPHKEDIWVLLKPTDNRFYPQSDHTNTSYKRNGDWQVITRFGGDKDEKYELIVYETDAAASEFFSETIQKWKDANDYPGLEMIDIPVGAVEVDRLSVSLKDNCRGVF